MLETSRAQEMRDCRLRASAKQRGRGVAVTVALPPVLVACFSLLLAGVGRAAGAEWSGPIAVPGVVANDTTRIESVSCASLVLCAASGWQEENGGEDGYRIAMVYAGARWHAPRKLSGPPGGDEVSCVTGSCLLLNGSELIPYVNGAWGRVQQLPLQRARSQREVEEEVNEAAVAGTSIACAGATSCLLTAEGAHDEVFGLAYAEGLWSSLRKIAVDAHSALSCAPSVSFCVLVTGLWDGPSDAIVYQDGVWQAPVALAGPARDFDSVSCASTSFCVAVDVLGDAEIYDGSAWSAPSEVAPDVGLSSVSCASPSFCVAVGTDGSHGVAVTFDTGSWSSPVRVSDEGPLEAVSCATSSFCVAGGTYGEHSRGGALFMYPASAAPAPGSRTKATLRAIPAKLRPGSSVRISGTVGRIDGELDCLPGDQVELRSAAFYERISVDVSADGSFATTVPIPRRRRPGSYTVRALCITASLGVSAKLRVASSAP